MSVAEEALKQHIAQLETEVLIQRILDGAFTDEALAVARQELLQRGEQPPEPLSPEAGSPDLPDADWVILEDRLDPTQANVIAGLLSQRSIPSRVDDFNTAYALGYLGFPTGGVRLRVRQTDVEQAASLIKDFAAGNLSLEDDEPAPKPTADEQCFMAWTGHARWSKQWSESRPGWISFSWPVLFTGAIWFVYRKMYLNAAILFGLQVLATRNHHIWLPEFVGTAAPLVAWMTSNLLMALIAQRLYYLHSTDAIRARAASTTDQPALLTALHNAGGVNVPAALTLWFLGYYAQFIF